MFFKKLYKKISRKINYLNFNKNIKILRKKNYFKLFFINKFIVIINENIEKDIINIILNNFLNYNILYIKTLILDGVGFKWLVKKCFLYIYIGLSHPKIILIPIDITLNINEKTINIYSFNKQRLGEYSNFIKDIKIPDNYKGRGIKFANEKLLIKNVKKK